MPTPNDRTLALCELSNDLLYHKILPEKLTYYVDESIEAGLSAAALYSGQSLADLYEEKQIKVNYREGGEGAFGLSYRGQITLDKNGCTLDVFLSSINQISQHSGGGALPVISEETARLTHLAHEFFHFLEYETNSFVPQSLEPVVTMRLLGLKRRARINRCSEVAAHAFAKQLLNLPVFPNYYDYMYLINTGKMEQKSFENMLERNAALLCKQKP